MSELESLRAQLDELFAHPERVFSEGRKKRIYAALETAERATQIADRLVEMRRHVGLPLGAIVNQMLDDYAALATQEGKRE